MFILYNTIYTYITVDARIALEYYDLIKYRYYSIIDHR